MLDMGFIPDVEKICTLIKPQRQTLLFSATMPPPIKKLADRFMVEPRIIEVSRPATTNAAIEQAIVGTTERGKRDTLRRLLSAPDMRTAMVFCNRKSSVKTLTESLQRDGFRAGQIHGDMEQSDRMATLDRFKSDAINILVCSDVAARGLDIKGVSHVFNFDVPYNADDYVHRIGRTGRAGATGSAVTLVTPDDEEAIAGIEKLIGLKIVRAGGEPKAQPAAEAAKPQPRSAPERSAPELPAPKRAAAPKPVDPNRDQPLADGADPAWNGPIPAFLALSARN